MTNALAASASAETCAPGSTDNNSDMTDADWSDGTSSTSSEVSDLSDVSSPRGYVAVAGKRVRFFDEDAQQ